jgi:hypothetical protein
VATVFAPSERLGSQILGGCVPWLPCLFIRPCPCNTTPPGGTDCSPSSVVTLPLSLGCMLRTRHGVPTWPRRAAFLHTCARALTLAPSPSRPPPPRCPQADAAFKAFTDSEDPAIVAILEDADKMKQLLKYHGELGVGGVERRTRRSEHAVAFGRHGLWVCL